MDLKRTLLRPAGFNPSAASPQHFTCPSVCKPQAKPAPAAMVFTGMHTFVPSPNVPAGQATLHAPLLQTGEVPGTEEPLQTFPQLPQLFALFVRLMHVVDPPEVHGLVAELLRAAQMPSA
jgi:hypothetical protein